MDNLTHSLVGIAAADVVMGRRLSRAQRPLFAGAGLIAANLPDIDIAYSAITPAPLGYLLHHRGHTHTFVGLIGLAIILCFSYRIVPAVRTMRWGDRARLWLLIGFGLASHLGMDALNSYGVHPFFPIDNSWYYGDAVFIFEPFVMLLIGIAVVWNGRSGVARLLAAVPVALLLGALLVMGVTPPESFAVLVIVAGMFAWLTSRTTASMRAGMAFIAAAIVVLVFVAASREARAASRDALRPYVRGRLVDVILTPNPASPMCWGLIGVDAIDADGEYVLWRGTLSLMPSIKPPVTCASHRLVPAGGTRTIANGGVVLREEIRQPIARLRRLSDECWTRAWLRFGRAPVIEGDRIFDLRFRERATQEFTYMTLRSDRRAHACPSYVPDWEMPRRDLFDR